MTEQPAAERRFVVLLHQPGTQSERGPEPHLDWMFEDEGQLQTWATPVIDLEAAPAPMETTCQPLNQHRIAYLDFEGELSGGRGTVARRLSGTYHLIEDQSGCFRAALKWWRDGVERSADLLIYRSLFSDDDGRLDESRESWRLRFSPGW